MAGSGTSFLCSTLTSLVMAHIHVETDAGVKQSVCEYANLSFTFKQVCAGFTALDSHPGPGEVVQTVELWLLACHCH